MASVALAQAFYNASADQVTGDPLWAVLKGRLLKPRINESPTQNESFQSTSVKSMKFMISVYVLVSGVHWPVSREIAVWSFNFDTHVQSFKSSTTLGPGRTWKSFAGSASGTLQVSLTKPLCHGAELRGEVFLCVFQLLVRLFTESFRAIDSSVGNCMGMPGVYHFYPSWLWAERYRDISSSKLTVWQCIPSVEIVWMNIDCINCIRS